MHDIQLPPIDELIEDDDWESSSTSSNSPSDEASTSQQQGNLASRFENRTTKSGTRSASHICRHPHGLVMDNTGDETGVRLVQSQPQTRQRIRSTAARLPFPPRRIARTPMIGGTNYLWSGHEERLERLGPVYLSTFGDSDSNSSSSNVAPQVYRRLTHYIEEPTAGRGFIKEQSFSSDGRLIASPFGHGVRLLAFDEKCSELNQVSPLRAYQSSLWSESKKKEDDAKTIKDGNGDEDIAPVPLHELAMHVSHNSPVLCAQFSPTHCLLASGCFNGKVAFYQPVF